MRLFRFNVLPRLVVYKFQDKTKEVMVQHSQTVPLAAVSISFMIDVFLDMGEPKAIQDFIAGSSSEDVHRAQREVVRHELYTCLNPAPLWKSKLSIRTETRTQ